MDTCLTNPNRCEADMCTVKPLTLQCLNIQPNFTDFKLGGSYAFTCTEVDNAQRYEFRALYTTQKTGLDAATVTDIPVSNTGNISQSFDVNKIRRYVFQCRPCLANDVCTEWGDSAVLTAEEPTPQPTPSPDSNESENPQVCQPELQNCPEGYVCEANDAAGGVYCDENGENCMYGDPAPGYCVEDDDGGSDDTVDDDTDDDHQSSAYVSPDCKRSGCSSQLCVNKNAADLTTTCEMRPEYACYSQVGRCEPQANGNCAWTPTDALTQCIADAQSGVNQ